MRGSTPDIPKAGDARVALVVSTYHGEITGVLRTGARDAFIAAGGAPDAITLIDVPGTFELPVVCAAAGRRDDIDAVVALGCVIRGETTHDQHINHAVAGALANLAVDLGKPVAFGVLTCNDLDQAHARAGGAKGNKGEEALHAALGALAAIDQARALEDAR